MPDRYVLQRPQVNGDWVTRDFSVEAELSDGSWLVLDDVVDAEKSPEQKRKVSNSSRVLLPEVDQNPAWSYDAIDEWVKDWPACGGTKQSPIDLDPMPTAELNDVKLPYSYQPMTGRALANAGTTVQVSGNLGTLTLPDGEYVANQFHFHFPAEHRIGGEDSLAVGEMRIVHQKKGSRGSDGLAMVSIMLNLPLESEELRAQEQFFIDLGMLSIPPEGNFTNPFAAPVDLSVFSGVLKGNFWQYTGSLTAPPCTEGVKWFIMEKHAVVSGLVLQHFKTKFPSMNARPVQSSFGRVVSINTLPEVEASA